MGPDVIGRVLPSIVKKMERIRSDKKNTYSRLMPDFIIIDFSTTSGRLSTGNHYFDIGTDLILFSCGNQIGVFSTSPKQHYQLVI